MPHLDTPRGTFYVADYRRPLMDATPTLLIHGAGGIHLDMPVPLRRAAALQPIAPDLSGHGRSEGDGHEQIEDYARDLLALLDAMGLPHVTALGHSMGGAVALMMALLAPERVSRLVLIGTAPRLSVNPRIIDGMLHDSRATAHRVAGWMWPKGSEESVVQMTAQRMIDTRREVLLNDYRACDAFDVSSRLDDLRQPTLILHGMHDRMVDLHTARAMAASMPGAQMVEFPDAGHMLHLQHADAVTDLIARWLRPAVP